jgi:predicted SAM-dependent methyltransferase
MVKLDLGGGQTAKEGFTNVDIWEGADVVHDLFTFPYPFEDESVEEIHSSHFIEHLPMEYVEQGGKRKDMLFAFVDECYRMLKKGGKLYLQFPNCTSIRAFQDPTHRRFIPESTVLYFNKGWRQVNKLDHYNAECDFEFQVGRSENGNIVGRNQEFKNFAVNHYWNVVDDLHFILTKI